MKIPYNQKTLRNYMKSRQSYLLYKKNENLLLPSEESELKQITKKLNETEF